MKVSEAADIIICKKITEAEIYLDSEGSLCISRLELGDGTVLNFSASDQIGVHDVFLDIENAA